MGLFFEITAPGLKRWVYRYKINGKNGKYIIGHYPAASDYGQKNLLIRLIVNLFSGEVLLDGDEG